MTNDVYNDDYLLMLVHEKIDEASEEMYLKYEQVVKYKASKYKYYGSKIGVSFEDLIQEGLIGLSQAIEDYSQVFNASFATFANLCIEREMQNCVSTASRQKHKHLNDAVSIDGETSQGIVISDILPSKAQSPEDIVCSMLQEEFELSVVFERLTDLEKSVFKLKYEGYDYVEIAQKLDLELKVVDNALQRIKRKIQLLID